MISFPFLNDLKNSDKAGYPAIVKKHCLTPFDLEKVAGILKAGQLETEWFNMLYKECLTGGLYNAEKVLVKYGLDEGLIERVYQRWTEETNRGKGNN